MTIIFMLMFVFYILCDNFNINLKSSLFCVFQVADHSEPF